MGWIVIEGLDQAGKTTVANHYKSKGFIMEHMAAPDKKFNAPGYVGPSYLDEIIEMLMRYDGRDVVWDRSWYGESHIWPLVYGRKPLLSEEDIEVIREFEDRNDTQRILMVDPNVEAHWKRCVLNNEPLTRSQFDHANQLYSKLAHTYNFVAMSLPRFWECTPDADQAAKSDLTADAPASAADTSAGAPTKAASDSPKKSKMTPEQEKLERANAINFILRMKRIFKRQGWPYDDIERDVRAYLNDQLGSLLGVRDRSSSGANDLTKEDIFIVKEFVKRLKERQGAR